MPKCQRISWTNFFFRILKISRPHRRIRFNLAENLNFCFKKFVSIEITGRLYLNFDSFMNSAQSVFSFLQISLVFQSACRSVLFMNSWKLWHFQLNCEKILIRQFDRIFLSLWEREKQDWTSVTEMIFLPILSFLSMKIYNS